MIREEVRKVSSGYLMLVVLVIAQLATAYGIYRAVLAESVPGIITAVIASIVVLIMWAGLFMIHPNEAKVLQLFGKYVGTAHEPGLKWANPFFQKTAVSTRVRNFESGKLKVNDSNGSPIEIAAVARRCSRSTTMRNSSRYRASRRSGICRPRFPMSPTRVRALRCAATRLKSRRRCAMRSRIDWRRPV
jgi:hypothetical protein